jgi:hypothetical protein
MAEAVLSEETDFRSGALQAPIIIDPIKQHNINFSIVKLN